VDPLQGISNSVLNTASLAAVAAALPHDPVSIQLQQTELGV
jgi:hypothetical protein